MIRKRTIGTMAALGGFTAAIALLAGQPAARADELSDMRANQELLQRRLDQLAQAQGPGNPYGIGGPPGPSNVQTMGGSFPRSFLIPGTDTSIRVGGEIRLNVLYWIQGGNPNSSPQTTNGGTTGQLNNITLSNRTPGSSAAIADARSDNFFNMDASQSKLSVETRTPTAWGEARSFLEFDFSGGRIGTGRQYSTSNNLIPRLRHAYGTLGGLLFGQANSNFNDSDAGMETLDFGGLIGGGGPSRVPQIRYTTPLAGWGLPGALSVAAETPESEMWAPGAGVIGANDAVTPAFGNTLKNTAPDLTAAWYIPQPWGHVDFSAVVRPGIKLENASGLGIDRNYIGYGLGFSGDVKPNWFGWSRDFITWNFVIGEAMGRYHYAGSGSSIGLVSNISAATLAAGTTVVHPTRGYSGNVSYRHVWTPTVRSNIGFGHWHLDVPGLNGALCPAASRGAASGGCGQNEELTSAIANVIWSPVSFVDIGVEYLYGHRFTASNARGDEHVVESRFRIRF